MIGHRLVGTSSVLTGDVAEGRAYLGSRDRALRPEGAIVRWLRDLSSDVGVNILSSRLVALWCLGYPDAARTDAALALGDAREIRHAPDADGCVVPLGNIDPYPLRRLRDAQTRDWMNLSHWRTKKVLRSGRRSEWRPKVAYLPLPARASDAVALIASSIAHLPVNGIIALDAVVLIRILARAYAQLDLFDDAWRCIDEAIDGGGGRRQSNRGSCKNRGLLRDDAQTRTRLGREGKPIKQTSRELSSGSGRRSPRRGAR